MATWDELFDEWVEFHRSRPDVYELFRNLAYDRRDSGYESYSADAIFHRIRWELSTPENPFILNDHYTAFYARFFIRLNPSFEGFFELRVQTSQYG